MRLILFTALILIVGCSLNNTSTDDIAQPGVDVYLSFVNKDGDDLLNPTTKGVWDTSDFDIYYLTKKGKELQYDANLDNPHHFQMFEEDSMKVMKLWLSSHLLDGYTTTYVKFPDATTDTLKLEASREAGSIWGKKLWYNGELIWEKGDKGGLHFTITK